MAGNFPELKEDINFQAKEAYQVLNRINTIYITVNWRIPKIKSKQNEKTKQNKRLTAKE